MDGEFEVIVCRWVGFEVTENLQTEKRIMQRGRWHETDILKSQKYRAHSNRKIGQQKFWSCLIEY